MDIPSSRQSGGSQGTARAKALTSERIAELLDEEQDLESELVEGVENAPDADLVK